MQESYGPQGDENSPSVEPVLGKRTIDCSEDIYDKPDQTQAKRARTEDFEGLDMSQEA